MNHELPGVQAGLRKDRGTRDKICQGPASAGSRGYPQDERRRREIEDT